MENVLRPYGLGATQWYVLFQLSHNGPTMQRELMRQLQLERATLSIIIGSLVRKGLIEQVPDKVDLRQKLLRLTPAGTTLWERLPDLRFIHEAAFAGINEADIDTAIRVLRIATGRLDDLIRKEIKE
ncbi:MarR family winged helix-turn-helix transcriptional regulator [Acerihabitans sp.]|uniref:MarR family winged helix-turn-helix transcriptional regulator n=1 Tax=Acerihabitans sp. TaxID=2811394 RepID=UPI002ED7EFD9